MVKPQQPGNLGRLKIVFEVTHRKITAHLIQDLTKA